MRLLPPSKWSKHYRIPVLYEDRVEEWYLENIKPPEGEGPWNILKCFPREEVVPLEVCVFYPGEPIKPGDPDPNENIPVFMVALHYHDYKHYLGFLGIFEERWAAVEYAEMRAYNTDPLYLHWVVRRIQRGFSPLDVLKQVIDPRDLHGKEFSPEIAGMMTRERRR